MKLITYFLFIACSLNVAFAAEGVKVSFFKSNDCSGTALMSMSRELGKCASDDGKYEGYALPAGTTTCSNGIQLGELKGSTQAACEATAYSPSLAFTTGKCFDLSAFGDSNPIKGVGSFKTECHSVSASANPTCAAQPASGSPSVSVFTNTDCSGTAQQSTTYIRDTCFTDKTGATDSTKLVCDGSNLKMTSYTSCDCTGGERVLWFAKPSNSNQCFDSPAFQGASMKSSEGWPCGNSASAVSMSIMVLGVIFAAIMMVM